MNRKHGMTGTRTYRSWQEMLKRVSGKYGKDRWYSGVTVCGRWKSFENFLADMGENRCRTAGTRSI